MSVPPFSNKIQRDDFFYQVSNLLSNNLSVELGGFKDVTRKGNNWMRLEFPVFTPYSAYELQFKKLSPTHAEFHGPGTYPILAYYFGRKPLLRDFLEKIQPHSREITEKFGENVVVDYWGKDNQPNYVQISSKLRIQELGINPQLYSAAFARFIGSTFSYVLLTYRLLGI